MVKYGIIAISTLFSSFLLANTQYTIEAKVEDNQRIESFPALQVSEGSWGTVKTDTCVYSARITQEENGFLRLEGKMECHYGNMSTYNETMPGFIMRPEGGDASFIFEDEEYFWEYSIKISLME
ncbi:hypothetical protein FCV51_17385 [Vibrio kanaloae]|nr:hypothetical protein [Vibrio kanaloae]NOJ02064.1 hypothetical protein [Vibrio kanaloae]TKF03547.1 hypothetical protein FCV46_12440 [Vibrio kanaloae]TKF56973.1 hypothetical protein FCV51_17385 [Vibrio kanaloae]